MASERHRVDSYTLEVKSSALRIVGVEVMLSGALMFLVGGGILALMSLDTQPGFVFILPGALMLAGLFYTLKGLTYLIEGRS